MNGEFLTLISAATPGIAGLVMLWSKVKLLEYQVSQLENEVKEASKKIERHQKAITQVTHWAQNNHARPFSPRSKTKNGQPWPTDDPPTIGWQ